MSGSISVNPCLQTCLPPFVETLGLRGRGRETCDDGLVWFTLWPAPLWLWSDAFIMFGRLCKVSAGLYGRSPGPSCRKVGTSGPETAPGNRLTYRVLQFSELLGEPLGKPFDAFTLSLSWDCLPQIVPGPWLLIAETHLYSCMSFWAGVFFGLTT